MPKTSIQESPFLPLSSVAASILLEDGKNMQMASSDNENDQ